MIPKTLRYILTMEATPIKMMKSALTSEHTIPPIMHVRTRQAQLLHLRSPARAIYDRLGN